MLCSPLPEGAEPAALTGCQQAERAFCCSATTNRTRQERRRGTCGSWKNKKNHMEHMGRGASVSSSPLDPSLPQESSIPGRMSPSSELSCSGHFLGSLGAPLPVGRYQEIELQWLCRTGAGVALPSRSPAGRLPSPRGHLGNTEFISMSSPEATALAGQLKQHGRRNLPVSPLQSEDVMLGEVGGGFVCVQ